ncbi:SCP2 sterol-binding domain-containing protein [Streptoalloteichus hindustanus]|uniref:SCP-2 sterol transfer family protein n=1 Tax=Streptoalloteichus hindustanus TaxID=2017 RepID=A0A1M4UK97_STRHI|nr:SCP2 sterol-binding domain-containing protein [Streptoalloteichus hindustanus]SHE57119.1 SCP-2 sterol transfer family protein [Streptoalloteichus hindustanus]
MSEIEDLTADTLARLTPGQVIELLRRHGPGDPRLADLDIDTVARAVDPKRLDDEELAELLTVIARLAADDAHSAHGARFDLGRMDPRNFARIMSRASQRQIDAVMARPELRALVLDEVFRRMAVHFRADRAGDTRGVVHFRITGAATEDGFDRYQVVIEDGRCDVGRGHGGDPRATVTLGPAEFLRLATGNASAPVLFMTGKLKVRGDLGFAAGFLSLFDVPRA